MPSKKRSFKDVGSSKARAVPAFEDEDEELQLEAKLFGSRRPAKRQALADVDSDLDSDDEDTGLGWMQDNELFTVDVPAGTGAGSDSEVSEDEFDQRPTIEWQPEEDSDEGEMPSHGDGPLWTDPADDAVVVSLQENKRMRKLARGKAGQDVVKGKDLQAKLRKQFEQLHPQPEWATQRIQGGVPTMQRLLASTASFISTAGVGDTRPPLPPHTIEIQRLRNANEQNPTAGKHQASNAGQGVVDFAWHPSARIPVMAVAGGDRRVRLFNVDGHTNAPLLTLHIPSLPLTRSTFHSSGSSLLLTGSRPFYYTYDLAAQKCIRSPRNLFGSTPSPTSPQSLGRHAFSPDGSLLAVAGRRGCVSVLEWSHGGSTGVVVSELRSGRGGTVADLAWNGDGKQLSVLGGRNGSDVEVWDVAERKIVRQWKDDSAFGGLVMRQGGSEYTAIGTGIVNLYKSDSLRGPKSKSVLNVDPHKSLEHLTTAINTMAFHPSNELFVSASAAKKDALKLYHLPSGTAYSNWPTTATPLGRVSTVGFSPNGENLAAGNSKGAVLLWSLRHFAS